MSTHTDPIAAPSGRSVAAVAAALAVMFMGSTLLTPLYSVYREKFGFSQLTLTLIYSVYVIGNLVALLFLGRLSDQIGRRRVVFPAMLGAVASTLGFMIAPRLGWLFAARASSGLVIGLVSGTATAWIAELTNDPDRSWASVIATAANYAGLAAGPLVAGILAQYAPAPLRMSFAVYLVVLVVIALWLTRTRETVAHPVHARRDLSLRPRIGVPREIRGAFISPGVTIFAAFALVGFYAALVPSVMVRDLHQANVAVNGAVVAELFGAGTLAIFASRRLKSRTAMLGSLMALLVGLALLVVADVSRSLALLLVGTAVAGFSSAIGYRGSLQVVNEIAPPDRRAEVVSSYLVLGFLGNSLPVVGVGVLAQWIAPAMADASLAILVGLLAIVALVTGVKLAPRGRGAASPPTRSFHGRRRAA